jgi:hypothetical protein
MWHGQEDVAGFGCPGNTCVGADGNLYEWVQGVDGLGNPVGFWRKYARRFRRRLAPFIQRALPYVQQAAAAFIEEPPPAVPMPPAAPAPAAPAPAMAGWGLGADELQATLGIGYFGELAQGPDGNLYQWVHGIDGLGNPVGFWKWAKRGLRRATRLAKVVAPFIPGGAAALTAATPFLRQAGVAGYDGIGALYEAPNGSLYQVQGIDADDELNGFAADDDLQGLDDDEELRGFADDDAINGIGGGDALYGPDDDDLRGLGNEPELQGFADDDVQGFADDGVYGFADDDVQGMEGYLREGMNGLDAYIPDAPRETPWFKTPSQPPPMWSPLW